MEQEKLPGEEMLAVMVAVLSKEGKEEKPREHVLLSLPPDWIVAKGDSLEDPAVVNQFVDYCS